MAYRKVKVVAACLVATLVQGSAIAVPTWPAAQPEQQIHATRAAPGVSGAMPVLAELLERLLHRAPLPLPRPGNWALMLAGLIGAATIARRRMAIMRHRSLAVRPPAGARRLHVADDTASQLSAGDSAGRTGVGNLSYGLAGLLLLSVPRADAQDPAKLTPFAEETLTTDDNVFRISKDVDPSTVIGSSSRADIYRTTSLGLSAEMPVSLQRFVANLTFNNTRYQRFNRLDSSGHDLRGSWLWQAGRNLGGELGYTDSQTLASFAELLTTFAPDVVKVRQAFFKGSWMVTSSWQLRAAADHLEQRDSTPATQFYDVNIDGLEAGFSRISRSENALGLSARTESAHFPVPEPVSSVSSRFGNDYRQYSIGPTLDWKISGVSHLTARAAELSRRYDQLPQRNFSGPIAHAELAWTPTGKFTLTAVAQRDLSPYEILRSNVVLLRGVGLRPGWHVTPKLDLSADLELLTKSYLADATQALGLQGPRDDRVRTLNALLAYQPLRNLTLQASLTRETRSSNVAFGDYAANVAWITARLAL